MGLINSHLIHDEKRDVGEIPVMGDGYCPLYDAALVGDWSTLEKLCEGAVITTDDDEDDSTGNDSACGDNEQGDVEQDGGDDCNKEEDDEEDIEKSRIEWISSLNVFDGGQDYLKSVDVSFTERQQQNQEEKSSQDGTGEKDEKQSEEAGNDESHDTSQSTEEPSTSTHSNNTDNQQQDEQKKYKLFIDAKGNTPLHIACRRDPPLSAVRALLTLHPPSVWMTTHDGWIPLHLLCHCGCDVEVANELLNVMEETKDQRDENNPPNEQEEDDKDEAKTKEYIDPLLPRDQRGRTPLHLACASSRDPKRRPDLVRLLLLRSKDPRKAVLARDYDDFDQRLGLDLALGELKVIIGGLHVNNTPTDNASVDKGTKEDGARDNSSVGESNASTSQEQQQESAMAGTSVGRTPLKLVEDDYREELEEALSPGFSIAKAIAACRGEEVKDAASVTDNLDYFYECWAMLSILLLAAGTTGSIERVKEALGDVDEATNESSLFSKPCSEVIQDFQAIHKSCQTLDDEFCPLQFKDLAKKLLQGQVDRRAIGSVSDLKNKWESRTSSSSQRSR